VRRKHPKLEFWTKVAWLMAIPSTSALFRRSWRGIEHVPERGAGILAVNHVSYIDPLLVIRFVYDAGRIPRFLAKSSLFKVFIFGRMLRNARQIPVYRGSSEAGDSLRGARQSLEAGELVVVYPEGTVTRDPDWWPMRSMTGIARLALASDVPVIPVAQWGAQFSVNWYAKRFRPVPRKKVVFQAGPPVDLSAYRDRPVNAALLREVTDTIMCAVRDQLADVRGETPPEAFAPRPDRRSAKDGSAKDGSAKDGSAKDGSAKDGSAGDGPGTVPAAEQSGTGGAVADAAGEDAERAGTGKEAG
jgi:1-acyl-sn-glycerol-3-phosphate acyltransferase